jgi:cytochrome c55X
MTTFAKGLAERLVVALGLVLWSGGFVHAEMDTERARELVHMLRHDCGSCHGLTLKGGLGPALLPENLAGLPREGLVRIILHGVAGTPMPAWRGLLEEGEAAWLADKLQEGFD